MDIKYEQIKEWLDKEIFKEFFRLQFKMNDFTINTLHNIMTQSKKENKKLDIVLKNWKLDTQYYECEMEKIDKVFHKLNLPQYINEDLKRNIEIIAKCANSLSIESPEITNIILMMVDKKKQKRKLKKMIENEDLIHNKFVTQQQDFFHISSQLKNLYSILDQQQTENAEQMKTNATKTEFLVKKIKQYKKNIASNKCEIVKKGVADALSHHHIVNKAETLRSEESNLKTLKQKINAYHSLPPDINLAKVAIEEARQELESIQIELKNVLGAIEI